ncbi:unnamed protein product, partial [Timema podura]|nr:unnamed protein product [Timema podura]
DEEGDECNSQLQGRQSGDNQQNLSGSNPFLDVPNAATAVEYKKGYVMRKCCVDTNGKKTPFGKRSWKMFYCTLRDLVLYLHKDEHGFRKSALSDNLHNAIRIHHALATKAQDYTKKQHVFRLQTADQSEYLFQTSDSKELQSWIDTINLVCASFSAQPLAGAVGSQRKFQRPLLPCSHTRLSLRDQLRDHEDRVQRLEAELDDHRRHPPDKNTKSLSIQNYKEKDAYLHYEVLSPLLSLLEVQVLSPLLSLLGVQVLSPLLSLLGVQVLSPLLSLLGVQVLSPLLSLLGVQVLSPLLSLLEVQVLSPLLSLLGVQVLSPLLSLLGVQVLSPLLSLLGVQVLSPLLSLLGVQVLSPLLSLLEVQVLSPLLSLLGVQVLSPLLSLLGVQVLSPLLSLLGVQVLSPLLSLLGVQVLSPLLSLLEVQVLSPLLSLLGVQVLSPLLSLLGVQLKRYKTYAYLLHSRVSQFPEVEVTSPVPEGDLENLGPGVMAPPIPDRRASPTTNRYSYRAAIYSGGTSRDNDLG